TGGMATEVSEPDDLYGLPPSEFVAARDALAKRLRSGGDKERAAAVKALRRPSAPAAALNAAARARPELVEAALSAAAELREATESAVGGSAADLRTLTANERAAAKALLDEAEKHLGSASGDNVQRMGATLRAATFDPDVARQLRSGTLAADHEASGFDFAAGFAVGAAPPRSPRKKATAASKADTDDAGSDADAKAEAKARAEEE